jgi:hypothetical protein
MEETKKILVNGKEYVVTSKRFDEDIDIKNGAVYHGFYVSIEGNGLQVAARKYDDMDEMSIQSGLQETDMSSIGILKEIAKQLFNTGKLTLLTTGDSPYKEI